MHGVIRTEDTANGSTCSRQVYHKTWCWGQASPACVCVHFVFSRASLQVWVERSQRGRGVTALPVTLRIRPKCNSNAISALLNQPPLQQWRRGGNQCLKLYSYQLFFKLPFNDEAIFHGRLHYEHQERKMIISDPYISWKLQHLSRQAVDSL